MRLAALCLVLLVVLAGCSGGAPSGATTTDPPSSTDPPSTGTAATDATTTGDATTTTTTRTTTTTTRTTTARSTPREDPDADRLGWESGYWYDDPLVLDPGDGYNRTELDRLLARTMARVERIRELEFEETVEIEVITREEYRERRIFEFGEDPWRDQVWEAAFIVDEDSDSGRAFEELYSGGVAGYYSGGKIVLVSDDAGVQVDRKTLAHELVHALQAQHSGFGRGETHDARQATLGLTEGEANYVMDRYEHRCGTEWECIDPVQSSGSGGDYNRGLFVSVWVPYSDGPTLIADLIERDGWAAVAAASDRRPASTEQLIHPEKYPDERPVEVEVADRSGEDWERFGRRQESQTLGEAALFAMLYANGVIETGHLQTDERRYNYSHPATAGWGGDAVVPYRTGTAGDYEYGYVFKSVWDTERDARQFHEAYLELLDENGATRVREGVYRIPEGEPYADAFRVVRRGDTVVVVNAPTVDDLANVHLSR